MTFGVVRSLAGVRAVSLHASVVQEPAYRGAEWLVFLHGMFGSLANWRVCARRLVAAHPHLGACLVDLRNHGASPHADAMGLVDCAADIGAFLDAREIERPVVVAHSLGAKASMVLALLHPERQHAAVYVDASPTVYPNHNHNHRFDALRAVPLATLRSRADADAILAEHLPDVAERRYLLANLVQRDGGAFAWRCNVDALARHQDAIHGFPRVPHDAVCDMPALFVGGTRSHRLAPHKHAEVRRRFPHSRVAMLESGHFVHAERPAEFVAEAHAFLAHVLH